MSYFQYTRCNMYVCVHMHACVSACVWVHWFPPSPHPPPPGTISRWQMRDMKWSKRRGTKGKRKSRKKKRRKRRKRKRERKKHTGETGERDSRPSRSVNFAFTLIPHRLFNSMRMLYIYWAISLHGCTTYWQLIYPKFIFFCKLSTVTWCSRKIFYTSIGKWLSRCPRPS